jgi:HD-like signal output (HDOD) protein
MPFLLIAVSLLLAAASLAIVALVMRRDKARKPVAAPLPQPDPEPVGEVTSGAQHVTAATGIVADECLKLAFSVAHFDYPIVSEHAEVLKNVAAALDESVHQREYFPRRPMQLPKLLRALNDDEAARKDLVRLILEDPTLAGSVLQRANSAFHRVSPEPVENIDRAVMLLGTEGLRALMAAAILQPVFHVPRGYFENFAEVTWGQAERTSLAAEKYARLTGADPFVAQILGLITMLAHIVLFRLTMDKYRDQPNVLPRADVFITVIKEHRARMAGLIAKTWELSEVSLKALQDQEQQIPPEQMSMLGRSTYFSALCGGLATLAAADGSCTDVEAQSLLQAQGLGEATRLALWSAATAAKRAT